MGAVPIYNPNNQLTDVAYPWDNPTNSMTVDIPVNNTVHYGYDELGRMTTLTPLTGSHITYGYDIVGRLKTITRGTDAPYSYNYATTSSPLISKLTRPNGSITQYIYDDPLKRLTFLTNKKSDLTTVINNYAYTYNNLDLKDKETITNGTVIDNFVAKTTTYTPNNVNQITSSANPNQTFGYDNDGNMTTGFTPAGYPMTLTYDAENRLASAQYTDGAGKVQKTTYDYSGDSLLAIVKKFENNNPVNTIRYVRAGFLPIQERDGSNAVTREYLWGKNMGGGIGGLLNLRQGGMDYNYLYDGKGNVTTLIDSLQTPVATYSYDPFGALMKKTGTIDQPFMFSTKQYDPDTGLSYAGYRFYSPLLGRWMTKDPLGERSDPNLYRFVGNAPNNWVDPFGLITNKDYKNTEQQNCTGEIIRWLIIVI